MAKKISWIPEGHHSLIPYLIVKEAAKAIEFYKNVLGAVEDGKPFLGPDGKIGHAELKLGDSRLMLADEFPGMGHTAPNGPSPVGLCIYTEDVDATVNKAVSLGAKITRPVEDKFYGDRSGTFDDPFGHTWTVSTHIEDVTEDEMHKRAAKLFGHSV